MDKQEIEKIIDQRIKKMFEEDVIRFKFTDDEYGEEAKKIYYEDPNYLKQAYPGDAGIDLHIMLSKEDRKLGKKVIWPGEREMLNTGIIMEYPHGFYGRIVHRSSTEKNHRLRIIEGIIDDYRGPILIQVHNGNQCQVEVQHGARLAQLIISKTVSFRTEFSKTLRESRRGAKGFGSSGK